ncbi:hypothetical protein EIP91_003101 [Steccherinum ochraceum]|uniref:Transcription factor IIA subunit alpha n=1 Tax=Steccherinum ochraceum TaxID=92696 RepID=A0A4R0RCJ6_9APHY|nr:hypothetical protein EIP91_003101 [Steccherinum ochraceum]
MKSEFDEYGVGEEVLAELQHKWEAKVIQSHVAEFEPSAPQAAHPPAPPPPPQYSYPPHPMHTMHNPQYPPASTSYNPYGAPPPGPHIKAEPVDTRYMLSGGPPPPPSHAIPSLPGPQIHRPGNGPAPPPPTARLQYPPATPSTAVNGTAGAVRIPQVDGPSSSSSDSPSPPPSQSYAPPRALHPSLPQPVAATAGRDQDDEEAINSDLDDSDSDNERDADTNGGAESDIVFCTYDKVARVKNKWKCVLKDGMIHVNGKDYLFAKCTGEFEW